MTLLQGDCLDRMKEIPDGSVDMVLCDLPYGSTKCAWDVIIPFDALWREYRRACKETAAIVLFGKEPFTSNLITSNVKEYRQKLTWLKTRPTNMFNAKKQFMNWTEDIVVFYRRLPTYNPIMRKDGGFTRGKVQRVRTQRDNGVFVTTGEKAGYVHKSNNGSFYPKTVLEFSNVNGHKHLHPTQKPVALLEYLIKTYTNPGETVLDNCMGSGSTGVACAQTGREFIGIELSKSYFDIAKERIEKAAAESQSEWLDRLLEA